MSVYVSIYPVIYSFMYVCIYLSIYVHMYLSIYLFMYVSVYISMYLFIYVSIYLSIHLCVYLCIYLSIYICLCLYISYGIDSWFWRLTSLKICGWQAIDPGDLMVYLQSKFKCKGRKGLKTSSKRVRQREWIHPFALFVLFRLSVNWVMPSHIK